LKSRTESPAIPAGCAAGSRLDIGTVMRCGFKMMRKVFFDHLFCQFASRYTKIAARPKNAGPNSVFSRGEILQISLGKSARSPSHDGRWRDIGRGGYQNMDVILSHYSSQNLNLVPFTRLADKLTNSEGKVAHQQVVTIFRHLIKMIFNLVFRVAALAIFHGRQDKSAASRMLPA